MLSMNLCGSDIRMERKKKDRALTRGIDRSLYPSPPCTAHSEWGDKHLSAAMPLAVSAFFQPVISPRRDQRVSYAIISDSSLNDLY